MVRQKIACYITGGWTECGYMTRFLEKINEHCDYRQRFPQKNIGKKGKSKNIFKIDGTTGKDLIQWMYNDLRKHREELTGYSAILVEDDLDDRFFAEGQDTRDYAEIEKKNQEIREEIENILGCGKMPVFFLYALPEIEAWFLADWDNTFGAEYRSKLKEVNSYFSITFKQFVEKYILTEKYKFSNIENYGYFNGSYRKLSDELIYAFQRYSCQENSERSNFRYNRRIDELIKKNELLYSKKKEGRDMLSRLSPDKVAAVCGQYFSKIYHELKEFYT